MLTAFRKNSEAGYLLRGIPCGCFQNGSVLKLLSEGGFTAGGRFGKKQKLQFFGRVSSLDTIETTGRKCNRAFLGFKSFYAVAVQ